MIVRRQFMVLPAFQWNMIRQWVLLVLLSSVATQLVTMGYVWYQDQKRPGQYMYVSPDQENGSIIVNPTTVELHHIVLPSMLIAVVLGCALSILAGIFYSHRLAGPLYHIQKTLREAQEGKRVAPIVLRKHDEFKELAEQINHLLRKV
jgi:methyl-accepting chemotaxis protein